MALPFNYQGNDPGRSGANIGSGGMVGGGIGSGGGVGGGFAGHNPAFGQRSIGEMIYDYRRRYPGLSWNGLGRDDSGNLANYQAFEEKQNAARDNGDPSYNPNHSLQNLSNTALWVNRVMAARTGGYGNARIPGYGATGNNPMARLMSARFQGRKKPMADPYSNPGGDL